MFLKIYFLYANIRQLFKNKPPQLLKIPKRNQWKLFKKKA